MNLYARITTCSKVYPSLENPVKILCYESLWFLFYLVLYFSILLYSLLFYFMLIYFILFYSFPSYSILFYFFYSIACIIFYVSYIHNNVVVGPEPIIVWIFSGHFYQCLFIIYNSWIPKQRCYYFIDIFALKNVRHPQFYNVIDLCPQNIRNKLCL